MCHPEIILEQGKKSVSSVLIAFGRLIRGRPTMHRLETSPERQTISWDPFPDLFLLHCLPSIVCFLKPPFFSPSAKSLLLLWLSHIGCSNDKRPDRGRERRFGTPVPSNEKWGCLFLRILTPAVFHTGCFVVIAPPQNCLGSGVKVNAEKGGKEKGWPLQSLSFKSSSRLLKPDLKEVAWFSLCLFHKAYFWILMLWDQAGDTWGEKESKQTSLVVQWKQVQSLVQEDPTCHRATKPVGHNY